MLPKNKKHKKPVQGSPGWVSGTFGGMPRYPAAAECHRRKPLILCNTGNGAKAVFSMIYKTASKN
jgi:hypothetical protein